MSIVRVAKRAGVSVATVSRVINDLNNVCAETVEQVRAAMLELKYTPPAVKRGPKARTRRDLPRGMRTGQIAILNFGGHSHWLALPVMASVVAGVVRAARAADITPILDEMPDPRVLSPILTRREVDGAIVLMPSSQAESQLELLKGHLPAVWLMGAQSGVPQVDHITADNAGIGRLAFQYLRERGCTELAFVTATPSVQVLRTRGQSFATAARDAGVNVTHYLCGATAQDLATYGGPAVAAESWEELADRIAAATPRPNGIFVAIDRSTLALHPLLAQRGMQAQTDVQIISCDNEHEHLSALRPRPATIDLNVDDLGRWAVRQLIHRLRGGEGAPARISVAPRLVLPDEV